MVNTKHIESIANRFMKGVLNNYCNCFDVMAKSNKVQKLLDYSPTYFMHFIAEVAEQVYSVDVLKTHMYPKKFINAVTAETMPMLPVVLSSKDANYVGEEQCICFFWASILRFYARFKTSRDKITDEQLEELDKFIADLRISALAYHKCSEKKVRKLLERSDMPISL